MKDKAIKIRLSERRMYKLRLYAAQMDKSMTAILEDCIDRLPEPKIEREESGKREESRQSGE